jgi:subtilisin family serine protease
VVVAAGNEAEDGIHWRGQIKKGKEIVIPIRIGDDSFQWIEVWIPRGINAKAKVETPDRVRYSHALLDPQKTVFGNISLSQGIEANGDTRIILEIENGRINHIWRLVIIFDDSNGGEKPKTREFHAWGGTDDPTTAAHLFLDSTDKDYTVGIPATVEDAIVVGSYVSNNMVTIERKEVKTEFNVGDISPFSSRGPTRKKIRKPDIVAPGQYITAAMASDSIMAKGDRYRPRRHNSGPYLALQGTSMATPFVAGVVALMLQRCKTLTPKDVRELLTKSARTPQGHTNGKWDPGFGFGLLDIKELFKRLECR